jgi:hypothetical protein
MCFSNQERLRYRVSDQAQAAEAGASTEHDGGEWAGHKAGHLRSESFPRIEWSRDLSRPVFLRVTRSGSHRHGDFRNRPLVSFTSLEESSVALQVRTFALAICR